MILSDAANPRFVAHSVHKRGLGEH